MPLATAELKGEIDACREAARKRKLIEPTPGDKRTVRRDQQVEDSG